MMIQDAMHDLYLGLYGDRHKPSLYGVVLDLIQDPKQRANEPKPVKRPSFVYASRRTLRNTRPAAAFVEAVVRSEEGWSRIVKSGTKTIVPIGIKSYLLRR